MKVLRKLAHVLLERWFPLLLTVLVVAAAGCGLAIGLRVPVPDPVPEFALRARPVYRAEVGAAWFVLVYLGIIAVALAADGRGFIKFGSGGVEAGQLLKKRRARKRSSRAISRLQDGLKTVGGSLAALKAGLTNLAARHDELEERVTRGSDNWQARFEALEERQRENDGLVRELEERERKLRDQVLSLERRIGSM
jgi:hypothetical protein